jgi:hypothetical protein
MDINANLENALKETLKEQQQHFKTLVTVRPFVSGQFRGEFQTILHNLANCINETNYILNGGKYEGYKEIRLSDI